MSVSEDVLSLPAGRELDVKVAEALMLPGIVGNWPVRPSEMGGWSIARNADGEGGMVSASFYTQRHPTFVVRDGEEFLYREIVPFYSTSGDEAVALADRFCLTAAVYSSDVAPPSVRVNVFVTLDAVRDKEADGETIPHAVARWVARYVKNGEVSDG